MSEAFILYEKSDFLLSAIYLTSIGCHSETVICNNYVVLYLGFRYMFEHFEIHI